jgi:hypothetical protein
MSKTAAKTVHAHWLILTRGPAGMAGVSSAGSMCSLKGLSPIKGEVTADPKKVTCKVCLERMARAKEAAKAPPPAAAAPVKKKLVVTANGHDHDKAWTWPAGARIHLLTKQNPCKPGTAKAKRWAMVFAYNGKTWEEYRDAEGNPETLRNAVRTKIAEMRGEKQ